MNVLLVTRYPVGGIRTYIRYMYSSPALSRIEGRLIAPGSPELTAVLEDTFAGRSFQHIGCDPQVTDLAKCIYREIRSNRPVLVHSHGLTSGLIVAPIARLLEVPHIITTHDVFLDAHFKGISGYLKKRLISIFMRWPSIVNPVGQDAADNFERYFPLLSRYIVFRPIRNGIQVRRFLTDERRDIKGELGLNRSTIVLGFFGRFMNQKGFGLLVEAVARLSSDPKAPPVHAVCFGWGGFIREEQAALKQRGLDRTFDFMPHTDDMPAALRGVDVVVIPSRWEACPLLPMEALTAGVPVVASDCIGMTEVTAGTPARIFINENVESLVDALRHMFSDLQEAREEAEAFRVRATERFDVVHAAEELRSLYRELTNI